MNGTPAPSLLPTIQQLKRATATHWERAGASYALKLFRQTAARVPAYKKFLKAHGIRPSSIRTTEDFSRIPPVTKQNYLRAYDWKTLLPSGKNFSMISASSGSSGKPFYWPRDEKQELAGAELHERIVKDIFRIPKHEPTLVVICFSMGTWIAGAFTAASLRALSTKGFRVSVITPGIEKEDAVTILRDLAPQFRHVILAGYPPFLRDIVEEAKTQRVPIRSLRLHLLFAGENFSEEWRKVMHKLCGLKKSEIGSVSIYGTADANAIGHETPASIFIRQTANKNPNFRRSLKIHSFIPTIVQYDPRQVFFETENEELVFTTETGIPLIRYAIGDTGHIMSHVEMRQILRSNDLLETARKHGFEQWGMPFILLGPRKDVAVTFYALNIYPENIKAGIEQPKIARFLSGKFNIFTKSHNRGRDQKLYINIELARRAKATPLLLKEIQKNVSENLMSLNMEYRKLSRSIGEKAIPIISLVPFGDKQFTVRASKYRWIKRNNS